MLPVTKSYLTPQEREAKQAENQQAYNNEQARLARVRSIGGYDPNAPKKGTIDQGNVDKTWSQYDEGMVAPANFDHRYERQSSWDAAANMLVANTGKFVLRAADGAAFLFSGALGLIKGAAEGEIDSAATGVAAVFDNPISKYLRDVEKQITEALPVYETEAQEKTINPFSMAFADKILDGVAYVAAMGTGLGAVGKLGSFGTKAVGKIMGRAVSEGKDLNYVKNLIGDTAELGAKLKNGSLASKGGSAAFMEAYGGVVESAAEASGTREEVYNKLKAQKLQESGATTLSAEQEAEIKEQAAQAGAGNFAINLITTGVANNLLYSNLFTNKWKNDMVSYNKIFKEGDAFKIAGVDSKISAYKRILGHEAVKGAVVEGSQELSQFASNDFVVNLMTKPTDESRQGWYEYLDAGSKTISNLTSKNAMESALIGGLIGSGAGFMIDKQQKAAKMDATQKVVANANAIKVQNTVEKLAKNSDISKAKDGSIANGDQVTYETLKAAEVFKLANSRIEIDQYEDYIAELEGEKALPIEEFKEKYKITDKGYTEENKNKTLDYTLNLSKEIKKSRDAIMSNYGHKITQLQQQAPDMLETLTMVDILRKDYGRREQELISKLSPVLNYKDIQGGEMSKEDQARLGIDVKAKESEISTLKQQLQADPSKIIEINKEIGVKTNELLALQNTFANAVTEANYKDFINLKDLKSVDAFQIEKEAKESTTFREYKKDIKDLKKIQELKEEYINMYSLLVNDENYALKVQNDITKANQSKQINSLFTIKGNTIDQVTEKANEEDPTSTDKTKPVFKEDPNGDHEEFIKAGDFYQLNQRKKIYKSAADLKREKEDPSSADDSKTKNIDVYTPWEVISTSVEMLGNTPIGKVHLKNMNGENLRLNVSEFKSMVRPIYTGVEGKYVLKVNQATEEFAFYRAYGKRAIQYEVDGKPITGMLGFYGNFILRLKYYDENGKLSNVVFDTANFYKGEKKGYTKILSEKETLNYSLKNNLDGYLKFLNITIENKKSSLEKAIAIADSWKTDAGPLDSTDVKDAVQKVISRYEKTIQDITDTLTINEEAAKRITELKNYPLDADGNFGPEVSEAIDKVLKYFNAAKEYNKTPEGINNPRTIKDSTIKEIYTQKIGAEGKTISELEAGVAELKKALVDNVRGHKITEELASVLSDESKVALDVKYAEAVRAIDALKLDLNADVAVINETWSNVQEIRQGIDESVEAIKKEYSDKLLELSQLTNTDLQTMKYGELAAIAKFSSFIQKRGFFEPRGSFAKNKKETAFSDVDADVHVTRRPSYSKKTVGSSTKETNVYKKNFYDNIQDLDVSNLTTTVIKVEDWPKYSLSTKEFNPAKDIFLLVTDKAGAQIGKDPMVVSVPSVLLKDNFGYRYRDVEDANPELEGIKKGYIDIINDDLIEAISSEDEYGNIRKVIAKYRKSAKELNRPDLTPEQKELVDFLGKTANYLEEITDLRELATTSKDNIGIDVTGKSNGFANVSSTLIDVDKLFNLKGFEIKVALSNKTTIGIGDAPSEFNTKPGAVYMANNVTNTLVPVFTKRIGTSLMKLKGDEYPTSFVDNIINGLKFLQESRKGNSSFSAKKGTTGKNVNFDDALRYFNSTVDSFLYVQRKDKTKEQTYVNFFVNEEGVASVEFMLGGMPITYTIDNEESVTAIKEALSNRIFNIDSDSLTAKYPPTIWKFRETEGKMVAFSSRPEYSDFVIDNFGLQTNLAKGKEQRLYNNGYLTLGKAEKRAKVEAPKERENTAKGGVARPDRKPTSTATETKATENKNTEKGNGVQRPPLGGAPFVPNTQDSGNTAQRIINFGEKKATESAEKTSEPAEEVTGAVERPVVLAPLNLNEIKATRRTTRNIGGQPLLANRVTGRVMSDTEMSQARELFQEKYGVSFELVKGLVDNDAYGMVIKSGGVLLSDQAVEGTQHHEEFHVVSHHIISPEYRKEIYEEWRSVNSKPDLSNNQVEEELAEEYRRYKLNYSGVKGKIREFFDYLTNLLRSIMGTLSKKDELFRDIKRGEYYGKPIYANDTDFKKLKALDLDARAKAQVFDEASFVFLEYVVGDATSLYADIHNLSKEKAESEDLKDYITTKIVVDKAFRDEVFNTIMDSGKRAIDEMIEESLALIVRNPQDRRAQEVLDYQQNVNNRIALMDEYRDTLRNKFGLSSLEELEIDENVTDRSIIKQGDNEVDFFKESLGQINMLIGTQPTSKGNTAINGAKFSKMLFDNLLGISDSQEFFDKLRTLATNPEITTKYGKDYQRALDKIVTSFLYLYDGDIAEKEHIFLQNTIFKLYSKAENEYMVLKYADKDGNGGVYYSVNQSTIKATEKIKQDLIATVTDNWDSVKAEIGLKDGELVDKMFGTASNLVNKATGKVNSIAKAIKSAKTPKDFLKNIKRNLNEITDAVGNAQGTEKIFSIFNPKGKLQYSIQNFSSLHKEFENYQKEGNTILKSLKVMNGIDKNLVGYDFQDGGYIDKEQETANNLSALDLHAYFYRSFVGDSKSPKSEETGMLPFVFSGDKSLMYGFEFDKREFSQDIYKETGFVDKFYEIFDEEVENWIKMKKMSEEYADIQQSLQMFQFIEKSNPRLYKEIEEYVEQRASSPTPEPHNFTEQAVDELEKHMSTLSTGLESIFANNNIPYEDNIDYYVASYMVSINEQKKLIGEFTFYKDLAKRAYAASSAKSNIRTDEEFREWYNQTYPSNNEIGKDIRSLVLDDVKIEGQFDRYEDAEQKIQYKGKYAGNNVADAQGYISINAMRYMLLGSGMLNTNLDILISEYEKIDNQTTVSKQDIDRLNDLSSSLDEQLSVLKPQLFGFQNSDKYGKIPTFYKFSVLPLTRAISYGKNLDQIRSLMGDNKLDLIMFESANKVGRKISKDVSTTLYHKEDNKNGKAGDWALNRNQDFSPLIQLVNWRYMGIQVEMPKYHESVNFGTQLRKLFTTDLSSIVAFTIKGKNLFASELIKTHEDLIIKKGKEDEEKLKNRLGLDSEFNLVNGDADRLVTELRRLATLRDIPQNFLQDLYRMESYDFITNKSKLQGIINSIVEKGIIRQKMTGDSKAMVSSVGFEKEGNGIQKDSRLKFYEDRNGNKGMEVYLPNNLKARYDAHIEWNAEENMYVPKAQSLKDFPYLFSAVGFRIPTQSQASMDLITIKGFLPDGYGNGIVVPAEITGKTGADFDIDKLNLFFAQTKKKYTNENLPKILSAINPVLFDGFTDRMEYFNIIKDIPKEDLSANQEDIIKTVNKYSTFKEVYDKNSTDNQIFELYVDTLASPEYYDLYVKSVDNSDLEEIAGKIEIKLGINKDTKLSNFFNPIYAVNRRVAFMSAKNALGGVALATTHHAESQKHNLGIRTKIKGTNQKILAEKAEKDLGQLIGYFNSKYNLDVIPLDSVNNEEGRKISEVLSDFVNACVDAAKNDYIVSTNFDLETLNVGMLLIRMGISPKTVLNFLAQPGIIEYTNKRRNAISLVKSSTKAYLIEELNHRELSKGFKLGDLESTVGTALGTQYQKDLVSLYIDISKYGTMLSNLQQATTFDTKGTGNTLEENEINISVYNQRYKELATMFENFSVMANPENSFTSYFRTLAEKSNTLTGIIFDLDRVFDKGEYKDKLKEIYTSKKGKDAKVQRTNKFKSFFLTYLLQKSASNKIKSKQDIDSRIANVLQAKKQSDNEFLKALIPVEENTKLSLPRGSDLKAAEVDILTSAFMELSDTNPELAEDIVLSGLFTFGIVNSPVSYMNIIPSSYMLEILGIDVKNPIRSAFNKLSKLGGSQAEGVKLAIAAADGNPDLYKRDLLRTPKVVSASLDWSTVGELILANGGTERDFMRASEKEKRNMVNCANK